MTDKTDTAPKPGADAPAAAPRQADPAQTARVRAALRENFGKIVMAMMGLPRYRNQLLTDLQANLLDPMLRDRIAVAYPGAKEGAPPPDMAGFAIWASVSEEVDARLREQIQTGVWPVRIRPDDWNSGKICWLLDVVATDRATTAMVVDNFRRQMPEGRLKLHPVITRLVDAETLEKMGMQRTTAEGATPPLQEGEAATAEAPAARH